MKSKVYPLFFLSILLAPFYLLALKTKEINPLGTYLYVDFLDDYKAQKATALLLKDIPADENSIIELSLQSSTKGVNQALAVFSNSKGSFIPFKEKLLSPVSLNTKQSNITTDIFQDFALSSDKCLALTVPKNADRLLFSLNDSFFSNNEGIKVSVKAEKILFQIKEKTIYQVVNFQKIKLKNPDQQNQFKPPPPLKNKLQTFDLARSKTALLHITYEKLNGSYYSNPSKVYKPIMKINQKSLKPRCFDRALKKETNCNFTLSSFNKKGFLEQTIILPMQEGSALDKKGSFKIDLDFEEKACKSDFTSSSFNLNILETRKLKIGFTLIKDADLKKWNRLIKESLLDFDLLKRIYPVPDFGPNIPQWIFLNERLKVDKTLDKDIQTKGKVENENLKKSRSENKAQAKIIRLQEEGFDKSSGLLKDLTELKKMRIKQQLSKLFAVADKDYFKRIGKENAVGFVIFTDSDSDTENIGFIRLDQGGKGTILHELGHLLGQLKEFYQKSFQNLSSNDICSFEGVTDYCFKFKNFKGFYGSLKEGYNKWSFITRTDSIMNNSSTLNEQWIDSDTYGKVLKTLSNPKLDPEILIFSGIFNDKAFIDPEVEYITEGYLTADNSKGNLIIKLLDEKSKELYSLKISTKVSIEFIDSYNKLSTTKPLIPTPVVVALPYIKTAQSMLIIDEKTGNKIYTQNLDATIKSSNKIDLSDRIIFE